MRYHVAELIILNTSGYDGVPCDGRFSWRVVEYVLRGVIMDMFKGRSCLEKSGEDGDKERWFELFMC